MKTRKLLPPLLLAPLVVAGLTPTVAQAASEPLSSVATWEMNEAPGASTMLDSSGHGVTGEIGSVVKTGVRVHGAVAYRFPYGAPNKTPADTPRLVTVNSSALNPGGRDFSVTIRYRTTHDFGNIMQKGQHGAKGGYWKLEAPHGKLTCLFRGLVNGKLVGKTVNSGVALNDGNWHTVTCLRTATRITMTIDGTKTRRAYGTTGTISNRVPMTIGGKVNCDQVKITCDFFTGDIDRISVDAG
ncbi:LamG domain-containing protein [Segeticoccus rhizosphaerae]|uniref:LamG domain-containing protein n=1 Tax=Segeticoccus rhizosphaerae TaxID=1104777 RepID=UPI0012649380|nr:LamG domain-containing protein [Segeticoccus rhizosphaerae]